MKRWLAGLLVLVIISAAGGLWFYSAATNLAVDQVTPDVYMLSGLGGNVAVLKTEAGAVVVDTMTLNLQGAAIAAKAESLTGQPVALLVNTHFHIDHARGNPAFEPGTRVLATAETRAHLQRTEAERFSGPAAALLPVAISGKQQTIRLGGKTIELVHPGPGHTDGDLVILFVEDGVLVAGDLFFNGHYPNIDLEAGGSISKWPATLQTVFALAFTKVIPGHGPVGSVEDLRQFQSFMAELAAVVDDTRDNHRSRDETIATDLLNADTSYTELRLIIPIGLTREFVLGRAWDEANGAFEHYAGAPAP